MNDETSTLTRRSLMAAGALGAAAIAGLAGAAQAEVYGALTDTEKKNLKLVEDFCKCFGEPVPDPVKIASYMTEDTLWKMGPRPDLKGRAAVIEKFKEVLKGNARFDLKISDSFARGSLVVHTRVDARSVAGGPFQPAPGPIAGVFMIKDGKIAEWFELFFPKA